MIEEEDGHGDGLQIPDIDPTLPNQEYVQQSIGIAKKLFNRERGNQGTKKANLGDIKSTKVNTPSILS